MTAVGEYQVIEERVQFRSPVFTVVTDQVRMPSGDVVARDYLKHVGAVAVVALDDQDRIVLVRQYRHPVREHLWELPAGLIDVAGEALPDAAMRELEEEADLRAGRLDPLVELHTTPGCSDERIRIYLARDLSPVPEADRHQRRDEEAGMTAQWFPLDQAIRMIFSGEISNGPCVAGLLAVDRLSRTGANA
jgi:8-oxo-dGTP pyrophosphatase MutT (NUDIX family)